MIELIVLTMLIRLDWSGVDRTGSDYFRVH